MANLISSLICLIIRQGMCIRLQHRNFFDLVGGGHQHIPVPLASQSPKQAFFSTHPLFQYGQQVVVSTGRGQFVVYACSRELLVVRVVGRCQYYGQWKVVSAAGSRHLLVRVRCRQLVVSTGSRQLLVRVVGSCQVDGSGISVYRICIKVIHLYAALMTAMSEGYWWGEISFLVSTQVR